MYKAYFGGILLHELTPSLLHQKIWPCFWVCLLTALGSAQAPVAIILWFPFSHWRVSPCVFSGLPNRLLLVRGTQKQCLQSLCDDNSAATPPLKQIRVKLMSCCLRLATIQTLSPHCLSHTTTLIPFCLFNRAGKYGLKANLHLCHMRCNTRYKTPFAIFKVCLVVSVLELKHWAELKSTFTSSTQCGLQHARNYPLIQNSSMYQTSLFPTM